MAMDWPPSLPVELREGLALGGGRGVFAKQPLCAGQLVLVESPLVTVPLDKAPDEALHVSLARAVLQSPDRAALMASVAPLHPVHLSDIPPAGLQRARQHYEGEVHRLLQLAGVATEAAAGADAEAGAGEGPTAGAGTVTGPGAGATDGVNGAGPGAAAVTAGAGGVSADDVLRLILAVQCNAFYSGFYLQCSMFNHCCNPSCIKLARPDGTSEVRALRNLEAGEECTISYLAPPLQSFARRVRHLEEQHYFVLQPPSAFGAQGEELACSCADQLPSDCLQLLLTPVQRPGEREGKDEKARAGAGRGVVGSAASEGTEGEAGKSASASTAQSVECVGALVERFEDRLDELEAWLHVINEGPTAGAGAAAGAGAGGEGGGKVAGTGRQLRRQWQRAEASALLAAAEQLRGAAEKLLGRCHVTMLRLDCCSLAAARTLLLCAADPCGSEAVEASLKLAALAGRLREGQEKVLGPDHHDLISTLESVHQALGFLLSNDPKRLFAACPAWASFPKASMAEAQAKKRCKQLQAAYSSM